MLKLSLIGSYSSGKIKIITIYSRYNFFILTKCAFPLKHTNTFWEKSESGDSVNIECYNCYVPYKVCVKIERYSQRRVL